MAVVNMVGVTFIGPRDDIEQVALGLLGMENFEPMSPEVMMDGRPMGARVRKFRSNPYDALLEKLGKLWEVAGMEPPRTPPQTLSSSPSLTELQKRVAELDKTMEGWRMKAEELRNEFGMWRAMLEFGEEVRRTERCLSDMTHMPYGRIAIGFLTGENWRRLREASLAAPFIAMPLFEEENRVTAAVFYDGDYHENMYKVFASVQMHLFPFNAQDCGQYEDPEAVRLRMESLKTEMKDYRDMPKRHIAENRSDLEKLYSTVYAMQRIYALCARRGEVAGMLVLSGWIPQDDYPAVSAMVAQRAPRVLFWKESGESLEEKGRELPTRLRNLPLIRRFQEIVRLYSLPSYSELDPTFVVAVSFCLFFGFMFGDIGHGLILILGTWMLKKRGMMGQGVYSVMQMAGIAAVGFGFLYGSVFGSEEIIHPLWVSPMKSVDTLLPVAIGVGIVFLTLGICFKIDNAARKKEWGEALLSPEGLAGLLFYWIAVWQVVATMEGASRLALGKGPFIAIMLFLFLVMIFGNGIARSFLHGEKVDEGGVVHVFSVFHAMLNFISNTASFVRLAAFALNHAGLCAAVFMLGQMVDNAPGGKIYHAFILLIGHAVIVALEGLIVFIQTLRLEYYEFFGKFYRGGGREFMPVLWKRQDRTS